MAVYTFGPGPCYNDKGITYRPFFINGKEVYRMDMSVMLGTDKKAADREMVALCEQIKEHTGAIVSPGELPDLIAKRKIVK